MRGIENVYSLFTVLQDEREGVNYWTTFVDSQIRVDM